VADKDQLQASFRALVQALTDCSDPLQPSEVAGKWTTVMARCDGLARNTAAWDRLSANSPAFDRATEGLDSATGAVRGADYGDPASVLSALQKVSSALDPLTVLLSSAGA
jgi:hypothetical protein